MPLYVDVGKLCSDEAYAILENIPCDGASVIEEDENGEGDLDVVNKLFEEVQQVFQDKHECMNSEPENEDISGSGDDNRVIGDTGVDDNVDDYSRDPSDDIPLSYVVWNKKDFVPVLRKFDQVIGPKNVEDKSTPCDFFQCFFDDQNERISNKPLLYIIGQSF
ncbi:hypothetical protein QE152_g40116 [Popillia japonica]|uniref:Uncharacterized protein n=1 Tax=Popillia japonica TaxID=7064 RepID=A0AAW1HSH2_POPJA